VGRTPTLALEQAGGPPTSLPALSQALHPGWWLYQTMILVTAGHVPSDSKVLQAEAQGCVPRPTTMVLPDCVRQDSAFKGTLSIQFYLKHNRALAKSPGHQASWQPPLLYSQRCCDGHLFIVFYLCGNIFILLFTKSMAVSSCFLGDTALSSGVHTWLPATEPDREMTLFQGASSPGLSLLVNA
jgi:hypothetical protein